MKLEIQETKTETVIFSGMGKEGEVVRCKDVKGLQSKLVYLGIEFDGTEADIKHKSLGRYQRRRVQAIKTELYKAKKNKGTLNKVRLLRDFSHSSKKTFVQYMRTAANDLASERILRKASRKETTNKIAHEIERLKKK